MSKLDKEQVLSAFAEAYKASEGKAPKVEEKSGWYSVDGGKNMRLAQLAEWTETLAGKTSRAKPAAKTEKAKPAAKKTTAKPKKASAKSKSSSGGLSAKELWAQRLQQERGQCRLPRGFRSAD